MNLDKLLKTGDEVRVKCGDSNFITTIDETIAEDTFTILAPLDFVQLRVVKPGERCSLSCVTERGLCMFETLVSDVRNSQEVTVIELKATSSYKKIQRREAFRVRENIEVKVRKKTADLNAKWINTNTVDISETGMLLRYDESCTPGQVLELIVRIDLFGMNEVLPKIKGRVARCFTTGNKKHEYLLGIRFEELPEKARNAIIKLAVLSQRSKLAYKQIKRYK